MKFFKDIKLKSGKENNLNNQKPKIYRTKNKVIYRKTDKNLQVFIKDENMSTEKIFMKYFNDKINEKQCLKNKSMDIKKRNEINSTTIEENHKFVNFRIKTKNDFKNENIFNKNKCCYCNYDLNNKNSNYPITNCERCLFRKKIIKSEYKNEDFLKENNLYDLNASLSKIKKSQLEVVDVENLAYEYQKKTLKNDNIDSKNAYDIIDQYDNNKHNNDNIFSLRQLCSNNQFKSSSCENNLESSIIKNYLKDKDNLYFNFEISDFDSKNYDLMYNDFNINDLDYCNNNYSNRNYNSNDIKESKLITYNIKNDNQSNIMNEIDYKNNNENLTKINKSQIMISKMSNGLKKNEKLTNNKQKIGINKNNKEKSKCNKSTIINKITKTVLSKSEIEKNKIENNKIVNMSKSRNLNSNNQIKNINTCWTNIVEQNNNIQKERIQNFTFVPNQSFKYPVYITYNENDNININTQSNLIKKNSIQNENNKKIDKTNITNKKDKKKSNNNTFNDILLELKNKNNKDKFTDKFNFKTKILKDKIEDKIKIDGVKNRKENVPKTHEYNNKLSQDIVIECKINDFEIKQNNSSKIENQNNLDLDQEKQLAIDLDLNEKLKKVRKIQEMILTEKEKTILEMKNIKLNFDMKINEANKNYLDEKLKKFEVTRKLTCENRLLKEKINNIATLLSFNNNVAFKNLEIIKNYNSSKKNDSKIDFENKEIEDSFNISTSKCLSNNS